MKIHISQEDILSIERKISRENLVNSGAYDGRYRNRISTDKRKEKSRRACRDKSSWEE